MVDTYKVFNNEIYCYKVLARGAVISSSIENLIDLDKFLNYWKQTEVGEWLKDRVLELGVQSMHDVNTDRYKYVVTGYIRDKDWTYVNMKWRHD